MYSWTLTFFFVCSKLMYYKMYLHKWVTTMATNWLLGVMNQPSEDINLLLHVLGVENYILYVSENWLKVCQYHWDNEHGF